MVRDILNISKRITQIIHKFIKLKGECMTSTLIITAGLVLSVYMISILTRTQLTRKHLAMPVLSVCALFVILIFQEITIDEYGTIIAQQSQALSKYHNDLTKQNSVRTKLADTRSVNYCPDISSHNAMYWNGVAAETVAYCPQNGSGAHNVLYWKSKD